MKSTKLNTRGFSHEIVIVAVLVLSGIVGSAALVLSHADSCTPETNPNTGITGPTRKTTVGKKTSCTPASLATTAHGTCTIALNGTSSPAVYNSIPTFKLTVKNNGKIAFAPHVKITLYTVSAASVGTSATSKVAKFSKDLTFRQLVPGDSQVFGYKPGFKIPLATTSAFQGYVQVASTNKIPMSCMTAFTFPTSASPAANPR